MKARHATPAFVLVLAACSGVSPGASVGGSAALTGDGRPAACACTLDQVCDSSGACIARPDQTAGTLFGQIELLQQVSPLETDLLGRIGYASATFNAADPLPADTRPKFATDGGEDCFFEVGTNYPSSYDGGFWPSTPGLDAGNLTVDVAGAAGPIELDALEDNSTWGYFHGDAPPSLTNNTTRFPDFFDPVYLPAGQAVKVLFAGGQDVGAQTISAELPAAFTITAPPVESSNATAKAGADLVVSWSPPQASAYMEIFVTTMKDNDMALLSCKVNDDGQVVIPAAAMSQFIGDVGIQLRRTTERYTRITQRDGNLVNATVFGRHARLGNVTLTSR